MAAIRAAASGRVETTSPPAPGDRRGCYYQNPSTDVAESAGLNCELLSRSPHDRSLGSSRRSAARPVSSESDPEPTAEKPAATSSKQMFYPDRQITKPTASGVKHGIGDGRCHAGHRYLAQALRPGAVELEIGFVDEVHVNQTDVRVHG